MNDAWVCASCKSINRRRDDRCYKCNGRRDEAMAPVGPDVRVEAAVANRAARGYSSSMPFAILTGALILTVAVMGFVLVILQLQTVPAMRDAFISALSTGSSEALTIYAADQARFAGLSLARTGLLILAILSFGLWLSRVRLNIPALGGGVPGWGPVKAFFYPIIPIVNIIKVPGMLQDALYRLDPTAGGFFTVLAAFLGLFGSWVVGLVGGWIIAGMFVAAVVAAAGSMQGAVTAFGSMIDQTTILTLITELMTLGGAILLVVIMARIERRAAARDREIRHAVLGPEAAA